MSELDRPGHPELSPYSRVFDETSYLWSKSNDMNRMAIRTQEHYFNQRLKAMGVVFLNEVYEALGLGRTSAGQFVGWLISSKGDGYIVIEIHEKSNTLWLDFNVDGSVYHILDERGKNNEEHERNQGSEGCRQV